MKKNAAKKSKLRSRGKNFPWTRAEFDEKVKKAVKYYWQKRSVQAEKQKNAGKKDAGTRGEVTGGKHLDAFARLIFDIGTAAGYKASEMFDGRTFPIPGYYRPQKNWDIVFAREGRLIAVVELKSQHGSFGNNCNNRTEEVLGVSHDFWRAYREKFLGTLTAPWTGYFFLCEKSDVSMRPVRTGLRKSFLPPAPEFADSSYLRRYELLCERLMLERDFTAASLLPTTRSGAVCPCENKELSPWSFCTSLYRHLAANV